MSMVGCFEGMSSERAIVWRCADSLSLREFPGFELNRSTPAPFTLSVGRKRLELKTCEEVFRKILSSRTDACASGAVAEVPGVAERLSSGACRAGPVEGDRLTHRPGVRAAWVGNRRGQNRRRCRRRAAAAYAIGHSQRYGKAARRAVAMRRTDSVARRAVAEVPRVAQRLA